MADHPSAASTPRFWARAEGLHVQLLPPNPHGVLQVHWRGEGPLLLSEPWEAQRMAERLTVLRHFSAATALALAPPPGRSIYFTVQVHDEAPSATGFRFDGPCHSAEPWPLIPDPYALGSWGYAQLQTEWARRQLPAWEERLPMAFWRGSTTGRQALTAARLHTLPRYRLCQSSLQAPHLLDARFTAVVQSRDHHAQHQLEGQLRAQGLLAPRCEPWDAALHRWLVEIDGNVNSWGLLWKLLSGCCVVRVASQRRQWYHHRLVPWQHVVPVAADLSDLIDQLLWCRRNPHTCAAIAAEGQALAQQVVADLELDMLAAVHGFGRSHPLPLP